MGTMIKIEGLPAVADRKYEELEQRIRQLFSQAIIDGQMRQLTLVGFQMPKDAVGASQGLAYIEFATSAEAMTAAKKGSGYKMSSSCTLSTTHLTETEAISASKDGMWTPEEDALILEGVARLEVKSAPHTRSPRAMVFSDVNDLKWEQIAQALPGRSASAVRDRYMRCKPPAAAPATAPRARWELDPLMDGHMVAAMEVGSSDPETLAAWRRDRTKDLGLTKREEELREQAIAESLKASMPPWYQESPTTTTTADGKPYYYHTRKSCVML